MTTPIVRVSVVTCHQFGLAALYGLRAALEGKPGRLQIDNIITLPPSLSAKMVGGRRAGKLDLLHLAPSVVEVDDATLDPLADAFLFSGTNVLLVAGWPRLISMRFLNAFRRQGIDRLAVGMHPSPLPHGRGQSPVSWTVLERLPVTAVTVFDLEARPDSGAVLYTVSESLVTEETATSLYGKALRLHYEAALGFANAVMSNTLFVRGQDERMATTWRRLSDADRYIDLTKSTSEVLLQIAAFMPPYEGAIDPITGHRVVRPINRAGTTSSDWHTRPTADGSVIIQLESSQHYAVRAKEAAAMNNAILDPEIQRAEPDRPVDRRYSGVLLVTESGVVALQRRDEKPGIINPGMITLFGGVNENGESDLECALREIREELNIVLNADQVQLLGYIDKIEPDSSVTRCVIFVSPQVDLSRAVLNEGARIETDRIASFLQNPAVSPVCQMALLAL